MGEFQVTEQIISAKQNQNTKEAFTRALSILIIRRENRAIVLKPEQEMDIYTVLKGEMSWQFCQQVLARA